MEKKSLDFHSSLLVAYSPEAKKTILSAYDSGYPKLVYRNLPNVIGGNIDFKTDISPEYTLIREIAEELDPNHDKIKEHVGKVNWASEYDIRSIRNSLFQFEPMQEFTMSQPVVDKTGETEVYHFGMNSVYFASIPGNIIETIERNVRDGKNMTTEGDLNVHTLEELIKPREDGRYPTAWGAALFLNYKLDSNIPHSDKFTLTPTGMPRKSFDDYRIDFNYNEENLEKASSAKL